MNLLTRSTDYAIRALIYMAGHKAQIVSTSALDQKLMLPRPFMRKTLQMLQKDGYLTSTKGNKGGFKLNKPIQRIRLIDVMNTFQGEVSLGDCLFKKKLCHCLHSCPLRKEIKGLESLVLRRLSKVTLADLMQK